MNKFILAVFAILMFLQYGCSSISNVKTPEIVVLRPLEHEASQAKPVERLTVIEVVDEPTKETYMGSLQTQPDYNIPKVTGKFTVKVTSTNYTPEQRAKLDEAEKLIEIIASSVEYKNFIYNHRYGKSTSFDWPNGLSNSEIYEKLQRGAEALNPAVNHQLDLHVEMYRKNNKTVGYTYPKIMTVYTNSKFHDKRDACGVAENIFHEWTHKMGFGHRNSKAKYSVPYAHTRVVSELCPLAREGRLTPLKN
jgi:hypothetical protein